MPSRVANTDCLIDDIRASIEGHGCMIKTGYGDKPLVYADYGASGRVSALIDARINDSAALYANPHNEDSASGMAATAALHAAYNRIKRLLNAGPDHALIACASGATGAIYKLQEIIGVAVAPATRALLQCQLGSPLSELLHDRAPVVFIGPYEHHSNELSWRESLAETVPIGLTDDGQIDLDMLERCLRDPRYKDRQKIGAFSAASNVTGVKTDVPRLARLLHAHDAILCLDCAASAPYLPIDLNPADPDTAPDAVYFSPHKMIGGPGACGLLVINKALYQADLPPTLSGGGTVRYVTPCHHDFIDDIESRERAGTPGLLQIQRAGEALALLNQIGWDTIEQREQDHLNAVFAAWGEHDTIKILGPGDPEARIALVSFNLLDTHGQTIHPRLVARLLNDLYGIQARAGCSCAGPYGHALLDLDEHTTAHHRQAVLDGYAGLRPGWVRVCLHWSMSQSERDYLIASIQQLATIADKFIGDYQFDAKTGAWTRKDGVETTLCDSPLPNDVFSKALNTAQSLADSRISACCPCCLPARHAPLARFSGLALNQA